MKCNVCKAISADNKDIYFSVRMYEKDSTLDQFVCLSCLETEISTKGLLIFESIVRVPNPLFTVSDE